MKLISLAVYFALVTSDSQAYVQRSIPPHLEKQFGLRDPKVKHDPKHSLTAEDFKAGPKRDPSRIKTKEEIRRVKDEHFSIENLGEEDIHIDRGLMQDAKSSHYSDMMKREEKQKQMSSDDHDRTGEDEVLTGEAISPEKSVSNDTHLSEEGRDAKPKRPNTNYLFDMMITIYIREKFLKKPDDLQIQAMNIEMELYDHEIDYQQI